jgi:hypothetical protein
MKTDLKITCLAIIIAMFLGGSGAVRAQAQDSCSVRMQRYREDLDRAIDRYGYDSSQVQHERAELQREAENCGYRPYDYGRGYRYENRYDPYDRRNRGDDLAFETGYRDGVAVGQRDSQKGKSYRPNHNDRYEDADHGYNRNYGDKNQYKNLYRQGFERGYSEGYGNSRQ